MNALRDGPYLSDRGRKVGAKHAAPNELKSGDTERNLRSSRNTGMNALTQAIGTVKRSNLLIRQMGASGPAVRA